MVVILEARPRTDVPIMVCVCKEWCNDIVYIVMLTALWEQIEKTCDTLKFQYVK